MGSARKTDSQHLKLPKHRSVLKLSLFRMVEYKRIYKEQLTKILSWQLDVLSHHRLYLQIKGQIVVLLKSCRNLFVGLC